MKFPWHKPANQSMWLFRMKCRVCGKAFVVEMEGSFPADSRDLIKEAWAACAEHAPAMGPEMRKHLPKLAEEHEMWIKTEVEKLKKPGLV